MSHHEMSVEDVKKHVRTYIAVFVALLVFTGITVGVSMLGQNQGWTVTTAVLIALFVASIKGSLVACYFMHLISEKSMLFGILALCAFFFLVLLLIPVITVSDNVGVH
ncbi:MAG: cytochrome C oxidase subunit IV family protein [Planctomycetes bacterium]|nr:cytochrome C oxidase subunit IV family protein [Planctomycetota bacterium]